LIAYNVPALDHIRAGYFPPIKGIVSRDAFIIRGDVGFVYN
jgi:hypothetical protein